jgi:hypothetical protein
MYTTCGVEIDQLFLDPINYEIMIDPVIMPDEQTYDRRSIARCLKDKGISPLTRKPMSMSGAVPNRLAKSMIDKFLAQGISVTINCTESTDNRVLHVPMCLKDSFWDLKSKLATLTGIPASDQVLLKRTDELQNEELKDDDEKFYRSSFEEQVTLDLRRQGMQVFLRTITGNHLAIDLYPNETLGAFRLRVCELLGLAPQEQYMTYSGRPFTDDKELMKVYIESFKIKAKDSIQVLLRQRGGSK